MLEVKVSTGKGMNKRTSTVRVFGFDKLTPRAARAALQIAGYNTGTAECSVTNKIGATRHTAYRVYKRTERKLYDDVLEGGRDFSWVVMTTSGPIKLRQDCAEYTDADIREWAENVMCDERGAVSESDVDTCAEWLRMWIAGEV